MLYKEHIRKIIDEVIGNSYGHWIGPDGTVFDVDYSHTTTGLKVARDLFIRGRISKEDLDYLESQNCYQKDLEEFLYSRGWVRGVRDGSKEYYVNGKKNQQLTPRQTKWLKEYGEDNNRTVAFIPGGENRENRGIKFIHHTEDFLQEDFVPVKQVTPEQEKMAKFFIFNVWRLMPKEDRFSPYQFSLWMDNERHLQDMKARIAGQIFPNDDEAPYKFFDDIITPTLEKMEDKFYERKAKKIDASDPLFILKSIVRGKGYRSAKNALYRATMNSAWQKGGTITDDMADSLFERQYRLFMGETMFDYKMIEKEPRLSDLRRPSPTQSQTEEIFVQHYAGWKSEKFPDFVKVWRGTNSPHNKIRPGDFVTFDGDYAEGYVTGKFGAVVKAILPSKDLKVYKMEPDSSEMVYWPHGHTIKKFTGHIPKFKEFWEEFR